MSGQAVAALSGFDYGQLAPYAGISEKQARELGYAGLISQYGAGRFSGITGNLSKPTPPAGCGGQVCTYA